jgi:hypothetical protein
MKRMKLIRQPVFLLLVLVCALMLGSSQRTTVAAPLAALQLDPNMQATWARTDLPVARGEVTRSWMWGPQPLAILQEPYNGGQRLVAYFDKGRMEVNNPHGDRSSPWFVTGGLLVKEMMSGVRQTGDTSGQMLDSSLVPVAGDVGFGNGAPSYRSLSYVATLNPGINRAADQTGQYITATLNQEGQVHQQPEYARYTVKQAYYEPTLGHNIPDVFWTFLNQTGVVYEHNRRVQGPIMNGMYITGLPLTEAYWTKARFGLDHEQIKDVLVQAFERRILTYTPSNSPLWQVEMGNTGKHYYIWLYEYPYRP